MVKNSNMTIHYGSSTKRVPVVELGTAFVLSVMGMAKAYIQKVK